jgi:hypothetical protein
MLNLVQAILASFVTLDDSKDAQTIVAALVLRSSNVPSPCGVTCSEPTDDSLLDLLLEYVKSARTLERQPRA